LYATYENIPIIEIDNLQFYVKVSKFCTSHIVKKIAFKIQNIYLLKQVSSCKSIKCQELIYNVGVEGKDSTIQTLKIK